MSSLWFRKMFTEGEAGSKVYGNSLHHFLNSSVSLNLPQILKVNLKNAAAVCESALCCSPFPDINIFLDLEIGCL